MTPPERATQARLILDNPILDEAFGEVKSRLMSSWEATHPDQWKVREGLFDRLQALKDVRQQLETFIHTAALETTAKVQHGRTERYNARDR